MSTPVFVEVTDTINATFITGFQRHTRELIRRLPCDAATGSFHVVPIVWCVGCNSFRHLDGRETELLDTPPPTSIPTRSRLSLLGDRLPGPLAAWAQRAVHFPAVRRRRDALARRRGRATHPAEHARLRIDDWPAGSWFFDLEAVWHNSATRDRLLPQLRSMGVTTSALIADVMPEQFPEWFSQVTVDVFHRFITAHLESSDHFVCISESTRRDLIQLARRLGRTRPLDAVVIPLGADFADSASADLPRALVGRQFLLCVGTLEPRKNQKLAIDALERLDAHPELALVLVGRVGWKVEDLVERIEHHPLLGTRLFWLESVDDALLQTLYRTAFLAITSSRYEGYGMPVIEALAYGTPTISSTGGALPEAGGDLVEVIDPDDVEGLVDLVQRHLEDQEFHQRQRDALVGYRAPTWDDAAGALDATLNAFIAAD